MREGENSGIQGSDYLSHSNRKTKEDEYLAKELVCRLRILRADGIGFCRETGEGLNTTNPIYCPLNWLNFG